MRPPVFVPAKLILDARQRPLWRHGFAGFIQHRPGCQLEAQFGIIRQAASVRGLPVY